MMWNFATIADCSSAAIKCAAIRLTLVPPLSLPLLLSFAHTLFLIESKNTRRGTMTTIDYGAIFNCVCAASVEASSLPSFWHTFRVEARQLQGDAYKCVCECEWVVCACGVWCVCEANTNMAVKLEVPSLWAKKPPQTATRKSHKSYELPSKVHTERKRERDVCGSVYPVGVAITHAHTCTHTHTARVAFFAVWQLVQYSISALYGLLITLYH